MSHKSDSPAAYPDVKYVMDLALKKPGLRYELNTPGKAIHFKQRCNKYRNLLRAQAQEALNLIPGQRAETAYDCLVIRQQDENGQPSRQGRSLIFDHVIPEGKLFDPESGEEIQLELPSITDSIVEE